MAPLAAAHCLQRALLPHCGCGAAAAAAAAEGPLLAEPFAWRQPTHAFPPWVAARRGCASGSGGRGERARSAPPHHDHGNEPEGSGGFQERHHEAAAAGDGEQQHVEKQQVLRQLLRRTHAAEAAMAKVLAGQRLALRGRPDASFFADQEQQALGSVRELLPRYRVRPSALLGALQCAGLAAGAAAALAPAAARDAVMGALQESLTELYNEELRAMRGVGLSDEAPDVRRVVIRLRDLERAAEGAPAPPDLLSLARGESLAEAGLMGALGALVKAAADAAAAAAAKL